MDPSKFRENAISPNEGSLQLYFPPYTYYAFLDPEPNATGVDYLVADKKGYILFCDSVPREKL